MGIDIIKLPTKTKEERKMDMDRDYVEEYFEQAEAGDAEAQLLLGCCYRQGEGVERNMEEAIYWVTKAAEQGYAEAQLYLADCYFNGYGVEPDEAEVVYWIKQAAEQGNADGQDILGHCYAEGVGVEEDAKQAVRWFLKAAEQGNADACFSLSVCYHNGIGVSKDLNLAVYYCERAAEQGLVQALLQLGYWYMYGTGVEKNLQEAESCFQTAIELGDEDGWEDDADEGEAHGALAAVYYACYVRDHLDLSALDVANCIPFVNFASLAVTGVLSVDERARLKRFLQTDMGEEMLVHCQIAAGLGNKRGVELLRKCRKAM